MTTDHVWNDLLPALQQALVDSIHRSLLGGRLLLLEGLPVNPYDVRTWFRITVGISYELNGLTHLRRGVVVVPVNGTPVDAIAVVLLSASLLQGPPA